MTNRLLLSALVVASLALPTAPLLADSAAAAAHSTQTTAHADAVTAQLGLKISRARSTMPKMRRMARSLGLKKDKSYKNDGQTHETWTGLAKLRTGGTARARFEFSSCTNSNTVYFIGLYMKDAQKADISAMRARMNTRRDLITKKGARHVLSYANPARFRDGFVKKDGHFSFGFVTLDPANNRVGQIQFQQHHYCRK